MRRRPVREVTCNDLRRELRVSDWWIWTREILADLRVTDDGREYMRFHKGPVKRLKEEVVPTLRFAERHFPDRDLLASFPASDQPGSPDALIRASGSSIQVPIQVTCDWTYEDEQRLRIVHRDGFVHGSGPVHKVKGRLETAGRAYSLEEVTAEVSALIAARIAAKAARGGYSAGIWLLVHINDERWPPEALSGVLTQARAAAATSPFAATFLIGSTDEKRICALLQGAPAIPTSW
jgi:hypothetical protein